jgi:hypothetical protein
MKKITLLLITIFLANNISAQITKTKIAKKEELKNTEPYDSLQNFLGKDVYKYLNQDLYLIEKSESLRKYGYDKFVIDYQYKGYRREENTYKCCDSYNSKYEDLKGKYFSVKAIHKHPKAEQSASLYGTKYYLELEEKESKDKVYYEYSTEFKHSFPFLVVGFYEKQKELLVGNEFVFTDRILKVSSGSGIDIVTGKPITIKTGEKWKCKDLTIEEKYYTLALVLENSLGETTTVSYDSTFDERHFAYTAKEADKYRTKFGTEKFNLILAGKVRIGMTKEMCKLSWGEPNDINSTISSGRNSEQWVYDENYLYFDNGILKTIQ